MKKIKIACKEGILPFDREDHKTHLSKKIKAEIHLKIYDKEKVTGMVIKEKGLIDFEKQ